MPVRKTISVDTVRKIANQMLANSPDDSVAGREGIAVLVERVLLDTGNYRGFQHIGDNNVAGVKDDSRRRYF